VIPWLSLNWQETVMDEGLGKSTRRSLLQHFAAIKDPRQPCKVMYALPEVLLLVVSATIAGCDDYDEIAAWGEERLAFLRRFLPYHWGVPCEDWLRVVMNRIDPGLFQACFTAWAKELRPDAPELIAIDGKTTRRSHDRGRGQQALHLVSAWASSQRLVLAQQAVGDKASELEAIPALLDRLALDGALVSIDAIACNATIAQAIRAQGADYLLAVKDNQPSLRAKLESYFETAPAAEIDSLATLDKAHGRLESRRHLVSATVDWMTSNRRYPGEPRFAGLGTIAMVEATFEQAGKTTTQRRYYISSAKLTAARFADAVRRHWDIENGLHWVLDVVFKEDQSRLRRGHGARNMAVVRHFAINLVRHTNDRRSIKTRRKLAGWNPDYLATILNPPTC
jgi:predicted transposase YbfD/YdcC